MIKKITIALAFCSCLYIGLCYFIGAGMSVDLSGPLPPNIRAFAAFGVACWISTVLALFRAVPAALLIWTAAIAFSVFDWHHSPAWMFQENVFRIVLWPVLSLSIAAWTEKQNPAAP